MEKKNEKEDVFVLNCPCCNQKSNFIKSSLPRNRTFDLRCPHCGAFCYMAPLPEEENK